MNAIINALAFPRPPRGGTLAMRLRAHPALIWLTLSTGEKVPALLVRRQYGARGRFLVLYSHGNAEDLAQLAGIVNYMAREALGSASDTIDPSAAPAYNKRTLIQVAIIKSPDNKASIICVDFYSDVGSVFMAVA